MEQNGIVGLTADFTNKSRDIEKLMLELGRPGKELPFYAIFPGDGSRPITFGDGPITQGFLLSKLKEAGPSQTIAPERTAKLNGGN